MSNDNKKHVWVIDEAVPEGKLIVVDEEEYKNLFTVKTNKTSEQIKEILDNYNKDKRIEDKITMVSTKDE
jgi:hypothetical protein